MELTGIRVKHKIFGTGTVTDLNENHITVQFPKKQSTFAYPDAFENFIKAEDQKIQDAVMKIISDAKQEKLKKRQEASALKTKPGKNNIEDGFGPDYNVKFLAKNTVLNYQQVEERFGIKIAGFGRGINKTISSVVLISSVEKKKDGFVYHDRWNEQGEYIYSGEGKTGDQKLTSGNRAIINASKEGRIIHLFIKFSPQEYYYQGIYELVDYKYEDEKDENGSTRKEYKFKLRKQAEVHKQ